MITDYKDPLGHNWDKGHIVVNFTCNGKGMMEYQCQRCDTHRLESESVEGHTPGSATTCTEPQVCTECGAILAKQTGHNFISEVTEPTCTTMGYTTYTCKTCEFAYKDKYIDQLGHHFVDKVTASTCLEQGFTTHACDRCSEAFVTDCTNPTGHEWDEGTVIQNATCTGESLTKYHCIQCNEKRLEENSANGHYSGMPATCTQPQTCTECGTILAPAIGHDLQTEVVQPTCTTMGYTTFRCKNCDLSYKSDYTDPLDYNFVETVTSPTCLEQGYTTHTCSRCKLSFVTNYTDALGHDWDEGTQMVNFT